MSGTDDPGSDVGVPVPYWAPIPSYTNFQVGRLSFEDLGA